MGSLKKIQTGQRAELNPYICINIHDFCKIECVWDLAQKLYLTENWNEKKKLLRNIVNFW